jgi:hypothetical protein
MAYGSSSAPPPKMKKPVKKSSGDLTNEQIAKLSKHKFNHTTKHIAMMRKLMAEGMSFTSAHNKTMKDIGK